MAADRIDPDSETWRAVKAALLEMRRDAEKTIGERGVSPIETEYERGRRDAILAVEKLVEPKKLTGFRAAFADAAPV